MKYTIKTNTQKRTATIRCYEGKKLINKYRAVLSSDELEGALYWTQNDIKDFLRHNDIIVIK